MRRDSVELADLADVSADSFDSHNSSSRLYDIGNGRRESMTVELEGGWAIC